MNLRDQHSERTRLKLVAAAMGLFTQLGFDRVGIRSVAEAAGVSTGAVFHKWAGKEAMFEEVMGRDWPDPAAFARFVMAARTIEEAREGAAAFLGDTAGADRDGRVWQAAPRRR
jgi:AcrR family transcriptional regulator